jgi:hypothetical protein
MGKHLPRRGGTSCPLVPLCLLRCCHHGVGCGDEDCVLVVVVDVVHKLQLPLVHEQAGAPLSALSHASLLLSDLRTNRLSAGTVAVCGVALMPLLGATGCKIYRTEQNRRHASEASSNRLRPEAISNGSACRQVLIPRVLNCLDCRYPTSHSSVVRPLQPMSWGADHPSHCWLASANRSLLLGQPWAALDIRPFRCVYGHHPWHSYEIGVGRRHELVPAVPDPRSPSPDPKISAISNG